MKTQKYLLIAAVVSMTAIGILTSSCARKVPFSTQLKTRLEINDVPLNSIQYFVDRRVRLFAKMDSTGPAQLKHGRHVKLKRFRYRRTLKWRKRGVLLATNTILPDSTTQKVIEGSEEDRKMVYRKMPFTTELAGDRYLEAGSELKKGSKLTKGSVLIKEFSRQEILGEDLTLPGPCFLTMGSILKKGSILFATGTSSEEEVSGDYTLEKDIVLGKGSQLKSGSILKKGSVIAQKPTPTDFQINEEGILSKNQKLVAKALLKKGSTLTNGGILKTDSCRMLIGFRDDMELPFYLVENKDYYQIGPTDPLLAYTGKRGPVVLNGQDYYIDRGTRRGGHNAILRVKIYGKIRGGRIKPRRKKKETQEAW